MGFFESSEEEKELSLRGYIPLQSKTKYMGVKALVESGLKEVPEIYIRPESERPMLSKTLCEEMMPIIDLSGLEGDERPQIIHKLHAASQKWGFFQVVNHGVPWHLLHKMMQLAKETFDLPEEVKRSYTDAKGLPFRFGTSFNPEMESTREWHDFFAHCFSPKLIDHPWPVKPSIYSDVCEEYGRHIKDLAEKLLGALSEALGLSADTLHKVFRDIRHQMRMNYYPPCPNPELALGISGHSDPGGLTILQQNMAGLQVLHQGHWIPVKHIEGSLVINIGDQLQMLTNGKYQSVEHRVAVSSNATRISIVSFFSPSLDVLVAPLDELVDNDHPAIYRPCLVSDYAKNLLHYRLGGKPYFHTLEIRKAEA